jgi:hypothetical protein
MQHNKNADSPRYGARVIRSLAVAGVLTVAAAGAQGTVINLQGAGVTGTGSLFCSAGPAENISVTAGGYTVVLSGGTPLGPGISNLPATASIAYGTVSNNGFIGCSNLVGYTDPITLKFYQAGTTTPENVSNFFINLYNGFTSTATYTLEDNLGHGEVFNIGANTASGQQTFGFASAGNSFTINGTPISGDWDFFVNDIGFNQALPPGSTNGGKPIGTTGAPEPGTLGLLGAAMTLLGFGRRRTRKAT